MRRVALFVGTIVVAISCYGFYKIHEKRMLIWLPNYIRWELTRPSIKRVNCTKHVMLLLVDHHEITEINQELAFLKRWENLSDRHKDADGKNPQYTFAYPYDHFFIKGFDPSIIKAIADTCYRGYGDLELQWHLKNETSVSFRRKLKDAKKKFLNVGALNTVDGKDAFGFIHGNWALDNSIIRKDGSNYSGVNNELDILREEGCFADFTFPAFGTTAQPKMVNTIYYALDDPKNPKSYNSGVLVEAGKKKQNHRYFMIFQGLIVIRPFINGKLIYVDRSCIQDGELPSARRANNWVTNGVFIKGKPSWVFVKLHMHGSLHDDAILGSDMDKTLSYIERNYNDGERYQLHYVTAREAYNIVKAAEAGLNGTPNEYRNFVIKPYKYSSANKD